MTPHRDDQIANVLVTFIQELTKQQTVADALGCMADHCLELLPADGVGVLLLEEQQLTVATTNSRVGEAVESLEVELEEGPCVQCVKVGHPVLEPDLASAAERYPRFVPRALDAGAGAIHALPMTGQGELVGSLNIVSKVPTRLSDADLSVARMLSDVAVSYIFAVRLHEETSQLAGQLQNALDTRVLIEQAKGMLSERHGETLDDAFERLRRYARSQSRPVREIARSIVEDALEL